MSRLYWKPTILWIKQGKEIAGELINHLGNEAAILHL